MIGGKKGNLDFSAGTPVESECRRVLLFFFVNPAADERSIFLEFSRRRVSENDFAATKKKHRQKREKNYERLPFHKLKHGWMDCPD
jgi:hypothetical protein